jgi:hypothetical protein
LAGTIVMNVVRMLEVILPLAMLRCVLLPMIVPLALRDLRLRKKLVAGWLALGLDPLPTFALLRTMISFHLSRFVNFWPDRLRLPRWSERMHFKGVEGLRASLAEKQPAVLVCVHHGPIYLLRYVLRAVDIPCAMLILESRAERSPLRLRKDSLSLPVDVPNVFCRDELPDARRFLQSGGCLLMAIDYGRGKMCDAGFGPGQIRIAKGAFRLAAATDAAIFPVVITESGPWQFQVELLGKIAPDPEPEKTAQKAMDLLSSRILNSPEQMQTQMADCLSVEQSRAET